MKDKYVIIPGCSDLNRGDQALVWETKRIAEDSGFVGEYYLTTEQNEPIKQSEKNGLNIIIPILEHPSRIFRDKNNIRYDIKLKIRWGIIALFDFIMSLLYFQKSTRKMVKLFISEEKKNSLNIMEQSKAFFMKGGGLLQTYGGITSTYSMYFFVYHILLAKAMKKPIYVMPNSFGPFEGPFVKKIARYALKSCSLVTSRESYSQEMVESQLNLQIENYFDLAFNLPNSNLDRECIFKEYNLPKDRKMVAITMRPYRFPQSENPKEDYNNFKNEMAKFIKWLYKKGYIAVIIEHTLAINSHENDGACINDVISMLNKEEYRIISNSNYNCHDLKFIYSLFDYIVGTRFHSVIFSLSNGVPGIAISYAGNKSYGIMHDIGLDEYVIDIVEVNSILLREKFKSLTSNENDIINKVKTYDNNAKKRRNDLIKNIKYRTGAV